MKTIHNLKRATVTTKGILSGNGQAAVKRFQMQLDQFLKDLERFDDAAWVLIDEYRDRLFQVLDMFVESEDKKKTNKNLDDLKKAWTSLASSAEGLGKDVKKGVTTLKTRAMQQKMRN